MSIKINILIMKHFANFGAESKSPCWDGYEQLGVKFKNGKTVPNCVKKKEPKKENESRG